MSNGFLLHEDSARVIIATGFETPSDNRKTGDMLQVWILCKSEDPVTAIKSGLDRLICGNCRHRGHEVDGRFGVERTCYVNQGQAPLQIYNSWKAGNYSPLRSLEGFTGRKVRFGAYGDPTHIPLPLALAIAGVSSGWTGYTHLARVENPFNGQCGQRGGACDRPKHGLVNFSGWLRGSTLRIPLRFRSDRYPMFRVPAVRGCSGWIGKRVDSTPRKGCWSFHRSLNFPENPWGRLRGFCGQLMPL